ncbi:hypothetical protein ACP4OV_017687 [Aristida adscensionis]
MEAAVGIVVKPAAPAAADADAPPKEVPAWVREVTEEDLAAAEQLLRLSVSINSAEAALAVAAACSATPPPSPPRSVATDNAADEVVAVAAPEKDVDQTGPVDQRVKKKYRLLSELYAVTKPVETPGASTSGKRKGKRKGKGKGKKEN